MNDRFRFRVWFKNYGEPIMLYDAENTYDYMGEIPESCFGDLLSDDDYILMQCTGLKDKNGTLIYEGDIVKSDFTFLTATLNPLSFDVGDVVFQEHFGGYVINSTQNAAPYQQAHIDSTVAANCEVIGNIYENRELLEGEKC